MYWFCVSRDLIINNTIQHWVSRIYMYQSVCVISTHTPPRPICGGFSSFRVHQRIYWFQFCKPSVHQGTVHFHIWKDYTACNQWEILCFLLCLTLYVKGIQDPLPLLQIFVGNMCSRVIAANRHSIQKGSIEKLFHLMGKLFASVQTTDTRLNTMGSLYFRLGRKLASSVHEYPPLFSMPTPSLNNSLSCCLLLSQTYKSESHHRPLLDRFILPIATRVNNYKELPSITPLHSGSLSCCLLLSQTYKSESHMWC